MTTVNRIKKLLNYFIFILLFSTSCGESESYQEKKSTDVIHINLDNANVEDISDMMDTSFFRVVALETTPEALVGGQIKDVFYRNSRIYVAEKQSKGIFMFDENGKFLNKIQSPGEGPEDYIDLSQVRITDDNIYIYDMYGLKILCYDMDCNFQNRINVRPIMKEVINPNFMWVVDGRMFFANLFMLEEANTVKKFGSPAYKVASMDMDRNNVKYYLPYDIKSSTEPATYFYLGNQSYKEIDGQVRFMTARTDTIWRATRDDVVPEYVLDFGEQQLPASMIKGEFKDIYENDEYDKYALVKSIHDTPRYLILYVNYENTISPSMPEDVVSDSKKRTEWMRKERKTDMYHIFIDKKSGKIRTVNNMMISAFDRYSTMINITDGPYLISYETMHPTFFGKDGKMKPTSRPSNPRYERAINEVYSTLTLNSNPIITILKFKE